MGNRMAKNKEIKKVKGPLIENGIGQYGMQVYETYYKFFETTTKLNFVEIE
jgi:hypothetical protein